MQSHEGRRQQPQQALDQRIEAPASGTCWPRTDIVAMRTDLSLQGVQLTAPAQTKSLQYALLTLTEQSLKLGKGIIGLLSTVPTSAAAVILMSIVQALLFASVRTLLGFIICMQLRDTVRRTKHGVSHQRNI